MGIIAVVVFIGVFAMIALPMVAAAPSNSSKQAVAQLDAVLKTESQAKWSGSRAWTCARTRR